MTVRILWVDIYFVFTMGKASCRCYICMCFEREKDKNLNDGVMSFKKQNILWEMRS